MTVCPGFNGSGQPLISRTGRSGAVSSCKAEIIAGLVSFPAWRLVAISNGKATEWLPTFGVSWQVVQVPVMEAGLPSAALSFKPRTPVIIAARAIVSGIAFPLRAGQRKVVE